MNDQSTANQAAPGATPTPWDWLTPGEVAAHALAAFEEARARSAADVEADEATQDEIPVYRQSFVDDLKLIFGLRLWHLAFVRAVNTRAMPGCDPRFENFTTAEDIQRAFKKSGLSIPDLSNINDSRNSHDIHRAQLSKRDREGSPNASALSR